MAGNDTAEIPLVDPLNTPIESGPVPSTNSIPQKPLLPDRRAPRVIDATEQPRQQPRLRTLSRLGHLLRSRQVEQQIGLDERLAGAVIKHQLLVRVGMHKLRVKLRIERLVDSQAVGVVLLEQVRPGEWLVLALALGLQVFGRDEPRVRVRFVPVVHEDVVFGVVGAYVLYFA